MNNKLLELTVKLKDEEISRLKIKLKHNKDMEEERFEVIRSAEKERVLEKICDELKCLICTEVFVEPTSLSCGHVFCQSCMKNWSKECNDDERKELTCPNCRANIDDENRNLYLENMIDVIFNEADVNMKHDRDKLIRQRKKNLATKRGTLKWFNYEKGYGFISQEDKDKDVFVHCSEIESYDNLYSTNYDMWGRKAGTKAGQMEGKLVDYEIVVESDGRLRAKNVTVLDGVGPTVDN